MTSTSTETTPGTTPAAVAKQEAAWQQFVDDTAKANYREMARDIARAEGSTPSAGLKKLAKGFDDSHESDTKGGWDYLAAWARSEVDSIGWGDDVDGAVREVARQVESAKRDPGTALSSAPAAVKAATAAAGEGTVATSLPDGVVPNVGPAVGVDLPSPAPADEADADAGQA